MGTDDVTNRLRRMGASPVPVDNRDEHITRMVAAATASAAARPNKRFGRVAVAAAAIAGFFAGSTGLAVAGALPDPAQGVAHEVLALVQVDVPDGKEGKRGPCVSAVASDTSLTEEQKAAAKDECPKGPFGVGRDGAPGLEKERPGKSGDAPGHDPAGRGNSGNAPGHDPAGPGNSENAPDDEVGAEDSDLGEAENAPAPDPAEQGDSENIPADPPNDVPPAGGSDLGPAENGTSETAPGQDPAGPGNSENAPEDETDDLLEGEDGSL